MGKRFFHLLKTVSFGGCLMFMAVSCKPGHNQVNKTVTAAIRGIAPDVSVKVQNGVVTLSGTVQNAVIKSTLDSTVKGLKGVVSVIDKTSLKAAAQSPPPPPSATPYSMDYPDSLVTRTLDTAFKYNHISGVKAKVDNGVITLTGNAYKKDLKTILLIANESHPKKVINKLTVK